MNNKMLTEKINSQWKEFLSNVTLRESVEEEIVNEEADEVGTGEEVTPEETTKKEEEVKYVNLCPHDIKLNDGTVIEKSGQIARVGVTFSGFDKYKVCEQIYGSIQGLPSPEKNTLYIVSALVLAATPKDRKDVVAPATGHPDAKRNGNGQIDSVPGFVI